jgi:hypothetical protein
LIYDRRFSAVRKHSLPGKDGRFGLSLLAKVSQLPLAVRMPRLQDLINRRKPHHSIFRWNNPSISQK